jgi:hypothetical protein
MQDYGSTGSGTGGTGGSGYGSSGSTEGAGGLGDEGSTGGLGGGLSGAGSTGSTGGTGGLGDGMVGGSTGAGVGESGMIGSAGVDDFADAEPFYRRHYTGTTPLAEGTASYEDARFGYAAGHTAAANPAYADRTFDQVEVEVRRDYGEQGRFEAVRNYARSAFTWKAALGAVAVAAGGYWASKKLFQAASEIGEEEERECRTFYDMHPSRTFVTYDQARTGYALGYVAARNPEYAGRSYDDVDTHLSSGYGRRAGNYADVRDFARRGYERGASRPTS